MVPGEGTRYYMLQLKIPRASTKTDTVKYIKIFLKKEKTAHEAAGGQRKDGDREARREGRKRRKII